MDKINSADTEDKQVRFAQLYVRAFEICLQKMNLSLTQTLQEIELNGMKEFLEENFEVLSKSTDDELWEKIKGYKNIA